MMFIMLLILCVASFALGVIAGIADCKALFRIPHGATTVYEIAPGIYTYNEDLKDGIIDYI